MFAVVVRPGHPNYAMESTTIAMVPSTMVIPEAARLADQTSARAKRVSIIASAGKSLVLVRSDQRLKFATVLTMIATVRPINLHLAPVKRSALTDRARKSANLANSRVQVDKPAKTAIAL
jgi:hypothetical protein